MEFIKDNLTTIIIVSVILIILIIILKLIKKKKKNKVINSQLSRKKVVKLEAKTVSIFEAINRETERQKNDNGVKYVNDLQRKIKPVETKEANSNEQNVSPQILGGNTEESKPQVTNKEIKIQTSPLEPPKTLNKSSAQTSPLEPPTPQEKVNPTIVSNLNPTNNKNLDVPVGTALSDIQK